jgi:hypothetical protein
MQEITYLRKMTSQVNLKLFAEDIIRTPEYLHLLNPICYEIRNSQHLLIENKGNLDETVLANTVFGLRNHYHVRKQYP